MSRSPTQSLRIALIEPAGRGGISHYTRALARALFETGHTVLLVTARDWEEGGKPEPFEVATVFDRLRTPPWQVLRIIKGFRPDLVHLQTATHPALHVAFGTAVKLAVGRPLVVTAHNALPKGARRTDVWASEALYKAANHLVVHGRSVADHLRSRLRVPGSKISVIPHGESSHLVARPPQPSRDPTILFFGYLHAEKGLDVLLDAMPRIRRRVSGVRLVIAGEAEMNTTRLKLRARRLGIEDAVEWRERYVDAEEMHELFSAARVVTLPYTAASMSGVLFLAGAFDRPVVATRTGDLPDVLAHGSGGLLVPPGEPFELAEALSEVLADPSRARHMGRAHGLRCRTEFGWSAIARRTTRMYRSLLSQTSERESST